MPRQNYTDEVFPAQSNSGLYPPSLNRLLRFAVDTAIFDDQSGEIEFNTAILDQVEAVAPESQIHAAIQAAKEMAETSERAAKNEQTRDGFSEIKLCLNSLNALYTPPSPKPVRSAPNNPYALPPEPTPSLSNVRDAMGHRSGKGR